MSTYTDMHCRVRENITVDSRFRDTNQRIRLTNEENEYWGTFHGKTLTSDAVISNVVITDSTLSSGSGKAIVDDIVKSTAIANRAYLNTHGLVLKQLDYISLVEMFAQGTTKGEDYELKANEVWRVNNALKQDYYEIDGLKFKIGDIFIIKNDVLVADITPDDVELISFGSASPVLDEYVSKELVKSCLSTAFAPDGEPVELNSMTLGSVVESLSSLYEAVKS